MKENKEDGYIYQEELKNYVVETLALVECLTQIPQPKIIPLLRDTLYHDGPKLWLSYMQILNEGANYGKISRLKAKMLHKKMERTYFEQYQEDGVEGDYVIEWVDTKEQVFERYFA